MKAAHSASEVSKRIRCSPWWAENTISPDLTRHTESPTDISFDLTIDAIMFALKDLLTILEKWPTWKKIQSTPENLESLEKRVTELEKRLARCPGEACPRCGELTFRVTSTYPDPTFGPQVNIRTLKCEKCDFQESRTAR
jgi:hypothetical protein